MNIRNIRVVQYLKNSSVLVCDDDGELTIQPSKELVSWKLQMAVDRSSGIEWIDVDVIEEEVVQTND